MSGRNWDKVRKEKIIAERGQEVLESAVPAGSGKGFGRPQRRLTQTQCPRCGGYYPEKDKEAHDAQCKLRKSSKPLEVPAFLPKETSTLCAGAIEAYQSGRISAALLRLRTFIEQTARRVVAESERDLSGKDLMQAYETTLHKSVRESSPSMAKLHSDLIAVISSGGESAETFEDALQRIKSHFEAKAQYAKDGK